MNASPSTVRARLRGLTLIESLVASSVLLVGISAAASMSLSLLRQEEINERTMRAANHLDNVARLVQMGMRTQVVDQLIPPADDVLVSTAHSSRNVTASGFGTVRASRVAVTYRPDARQPSAQRTIAVEVIGDGGLLMNPGKRLLHHEGPPF